MKRIVTAINNPILNEELKKENDFEVIGKDIQYKEAVLEIIKKNKEINILIISEKIPGEISLEKLIEKIKLINEKIKIIFILEKENNKLEKILLENKIIDIYYNNKINLNELIKIINKNEINMEEEIIKLKKIIEKNSKEKKKKIKKFNKLKKEIENRLKKSKREKTKSNKKILTISGNSNSGKSTISLILSAYLANTNKRVLLVDGDLKNKDLNFILKNKIRKKNKKSEKNNYYKNYLKNRIEKYNKFILNKKNIINFKRKIKLKRINNKKLINKKNKIIENKIKQSIKLNTIKIENNFYFFGDLKNIFLKRKNEKNIKKIVLYFFEKTKENFDIIIFDLSKNNFASINKEIIKNSNINLVVTEPELLGIRDIQKLLKKYKYSWKIANESLHIVCNKKKSFSINKNLIYKILYCKNKILEIRENKIYHFCTNYLIKRSFLLNSKIIKREIKKIIKIIN